MGTCHGTLENGSPWASTHILGCWESIGIGVWLFYRIRMEREEETECLCNPAPLPAQLSCWSIPVPSHNAQFLPFIPSFGCSLQPGWLSRALQSHKGCQWWRWRCSSAPPPFAAAPGLRVCTGATEVIKHRSSFCCSCINPVLKYNLKRLKILLTEINFSWRTFDLRDSSFHFQIHYPILNYGFYYKSLFLHSL